MRLPLGVLHHQAEGRQPRVRGAAGRWGRFLPGKALLPVDDLRQKGLQGLLQAVHIGKLRIMAFPEDDGIQFWMNGKGRSACLGAQQGGFQQGAAERVVLGREFAHLAVQDEGMVLAVRGEGDGMLSVKKQGALSVGIKAKVVDAQCIAQFGQQCGKFHVGLLRGE